MGEDRTESLEEFRSRARAWLAENAARATVGGSALVTGVESEEELAAAAE